MIAIYARELMRRGHQVRLISVPEPTLPLIERAKRWLAGKPIVSAARGAISHLSDAGVDWHVLDEWRPITDEDVPDGDVIVATWWRTAEWVSALSSRKGAKVYFIQGHEVFSYLPVDRCRATYQLPFYKIVVSNWLKRILESEYGSRQVDIVPNSVDKTQFFSGVRAKQARPTIGFLYSLAQIKGSDVALNAIQLVRQKFPDLRVLAFGEAQPQENPVLFAEVEFSLRPPQDQIRQLYGSCDVWLSSSRSEGFNLTAMEAMACRTPVVSTRTGWPEESIVDGRNGWLADVDDFEQLARGLERVLELDSVSWSSLSAHAYEAVADSSWEASAAKFEASLKTAWEQQQRC